jgi:hypothetical protein
MWAGGEPDWMASPIVLGQSLRWADTRNWFNPRSCFNPPRSSIQCAGQGPLNRFNIGRRGFHSPRGG